MALSRCAVPASFLALTAGPAVAEPAKAPAPSSCSYYKTVRPLFQQHCQGCHQPAKAQGGFVMTGHADLLKKGNSDEPGVLPGQPDKSAVVRMITPQGGKAAAMPKSKPPLPDAQVALIKQWIAEGAKDDTPATARLLVDADHPPSYLLPP